MTGLPEEVAPEMLESDTFMKAFHHVLLEVRRSRGAVSGGGAARAHACLPHQRRHSYRAGARGGGCAHLSRVWTPVSNQARVRLDFLLRSLTHSSETTLTPASCACCSEGIPNMLLAEDEVAAK
jgi:hypothetical protein